MLRGHPIADNSWYRVTIESIEPLALSVRTDYEGSEHTVEVSAEHDLLRFRGLDDVSPKMSAIIINGLYRCLKSSLHVDVTHGPLGGLSVVSAPSVEAAAMGIAEQFVSRCEWFAYEADNLRDIRTLKAKYMECSGMIQ